MDPKLYKLRLNFHYLSLSVISDSQKILKVIRQAFPKSFGTRLKERLSIYMIENPQRFEKYTQKKKSFTMPGAYRMAFSEDWKTAYSLVRRKDSYNLILHLGLLIPLSFLASSRQDYFVHGALLARSGKGVLILGPKGTGKSLLSLLCLERGWHYFSDEHPLLKGSQKAVWGYGFANPIGLPKIALKNVTNSARKLKWSASRGKFIFDFRKVPRTLFGKKCRIAKLVFPKFSPKKKLRIKKLKFPVALAMALRDEYFMMSWKHGYEAFSRRHFQLITSLIETADAYAVDYGIKDIARMPQILAGRLK